MDREQQALVPEDIVSEVRDAMGHLYDSAYLVRHPLLRRIADLSDLDSTSSVRSLRRLLLSTTEELRPPYGTPDDDPAWRPYRVIWERFVVCRQLAEVESDLALGRRQIQREQRRGFELLSLKLWERCGQEREVDAGARDAIEREATRLARKQRVGVAEQLTRALASVASLADQLGVIVEPDLGVGPATASGDPTLLRQLIVAVLSSAVRHVPGGRVCASLAGGNGEAVLTVTSVAGEGRAAAPSPLTTSMLALADGQDARVLEEGDGGDRRIVVSFAPAPPEYLVAFVEDNGDVVAVFQRYLAGQGYRLEAVSESNSVVEHLAELGPDAILLDIMMQDLDGWEVLRRVKSDLRLRDVPTVVCSVLNEPELAASLGADAYLCKPVRPARLLECLGGLLSH